MKAFWLVIKTLMYGGGFLAAFAGWLPLRVFERRAHLPAAWEEPQWAGAGILALGALIILWSSWTLVSRGRGTPAPFDPTVKFVRRGLYKWVRNPMYLAVFTLVAWAFAYVYVVLQAVDPGSFGTGASHAHSWMDLLFLSFTVLTGTGLSEIMPITGHAKSVVMIEQVVGLLYVAMVVTRLVGLQAMRKRA